MGVAQVSQSLGSPSPHSYRPSLRVCPGLGLRSLYPTEQPLLCPPMAHWPSLPPEPGGGPSGPMGSSRVWWGVTLQSLPWDARAWPESSRSERGQDPLAVAPGRGGSDEVGD